ncbi:capsular polysaccharide export protein, LipB/KpsS family, partial [Bordetella pertussis]
VALARASGVRVHVFEEGYFRPHWVTLERGGVNAHSSHACNAWNPLLFPRYRTHAPHGAAREYAAY